MFDNYDWMLNCKTPENAADCAADLLRHGWRIVTMGEESSLVHVIDIPATKVYWFADRHGADARPVGTWMTPPKA